MGRISRSLDANPYRADFEHRATYNRQKGHGVMIRDIIEIGQKFHLDDHRGRDVVLPAPHSFRVGLESCRLQCLLQTLRVDGAPENFEIDLNGEGLPTPLDPATGTYALDARRPRS